MINLLPPKYREELQTEETRRLVIILGSLTSLFLLSFALILLALNLYLSGKVQSKETLFQFERQKFEVQEIQELQEHINLANQRISLLAEFYTQKVSLISIFDRVEKTIPAEIYLTDFSYAKENSQITLAGFSPSREILFQFKKNLEKDFQNVYFPPESWIQSTDIDFRGVSFTLQK